MLFVWRHHPESDRGIKVLQTSALPLGYGAVNLLIYYSRNTCVCQGLFTVFRKYFSSHYISQVLLAENGKQHPETSFFCETRIFILRYYSYASTRHFPSRNFMKFARSSAEAKQDIGKTYAMLLLI